MLRERFQKVKFNNMDLDSQETKFVNMDLDSQKIKLKLIFNPLNPKDLYIGLAVSLTYLSQMIPTKLPVHVNACCF